MGFIRGACYPVQGKTTESVRLYLKMLTNLYFPSLFSYENEIEYLDAVTVVAFYRYGQSFKGRDYSD